MILWLICSLHCVDSVGSGCTIWEHYPCVCEYFCAGRETGMHTLNGLFLLLVDPSLIIFQNVTSSNDLLTETSAHPSEDVNTSTHPPEVNPCHCNEPVSFVSVGLGRSHIAQTELLAQLHIYLQRFVLDRSYYLSMTPSYLLHGFVVALLLLGIASVVFVYARLQNNLRRRIELDIELERAPWAMKQCTRDGFLNQRERAWTFDPAVCWQFGHCPLSLLSLKFGNWAFFADCVVFFVFENTKHLAKLEQCINLSQMFSRHTKKFRLLREVVYFPISMTDCFVGHFFLAFCVFFRFSCFRCLPKVLLCFDRLCTISSRSLDCWMPRLAAVSYEQFHTVDCINFQCLVFWMFFDTASCGFQVFKQRQACHELQEGFSLHPPSSLTQDLTAK